MRKFAFFFFCFVSVLGFSACGSENQEVPPVTRIDASESEEKQAELPLSAGNGNDTGVSGETMADQTNISRQESEEESEEESEGKDAAGENSFDFETKTVLLNSGYEMPIYGIGTYSLTGDTCVESVTAALNSGVRLIDTAYMYHNEESVGEAVRNSGIPREEIFVITKIYPSQFSDPEAAIEEALEKLDIDYIDARVIIGPS